MIISHEHRFIFLHCRKVAGSSIKVALSSVLGPNDIQLGGWLDCYSHGIKPNAKAYSDLKHPLALSDYVLRLFSRPHLLRSEHHKVWAFNGAIKCKYRRRLGAYPEHASAEDTRALFADIWNSYYKFCFIRNPFDRVVSEYQWVMRTRKISGVSFSDFLKALLEPHRYPKWINPRFDNWDIYTINNEVVVDKIGKFESLQSDFNDACEQMGLSIGKEALPHAKNSTRNSSYRDWYSESDIALVSALFENELKRFNYEF